MTVIDKLIWFKGEIMPIEEAKINIMTTTAQYGINVFEGVRCYYNADAKKLFGFRADEHIKRLFDSSKLLRFDLGNIYTPDYIRCIFQETIRANKLFEDCYVKIGFYLDGEGSWSGLGPISAFIAPSPKGRVYADKNGVECCIVSWQRINETTIPPRIKAGANYINSRFAHLEAVRNNYDLAIFMDRNGKISEGTGACLFMIRNNQLITPPVTGSILESITRDTIIKIARNDLTFEVVERKIDRTELYLSDELFFVGTTVEILPIISVDRIKINDNQPGKVVKILSERYYEIVYGRNPNYSSWLTSIY